MKLSHRLETIASFVRRGSIIADIGTDHGYIPIYLVKEGISPAPGHGCAERAFGARKAHVHEWSGRQDRPEAERRPACLEAGEADTIDSRMGGELMVRILE